MRRIAAGVIAVAAGGSLLLTGGAAVAAAPKFDVKVNITRVDPDPVVVKKHGVTPVKIDVFSKDAVRVEVTLKPFGFKYANYTPKEARTFNRGDFKRFVANFDSRDPAGTWIATATAFDRFGRKVLDNERFAVEVEKRKFRTEIRGWKVTPTVVRKGKSIFFKGYLHAEKRGFKGYGDQEVGIYYRSHPRREWRLVTETETDRFGKFTAKTRALTSGEFRAVFQGNDEANGAESRPIRVSVKRGFGF